MRSGKLDWRLCNRWQCWEELYTLWTAGEWRIQLRHKSWGAKVGGSEGQVGVDSDHVPGNCEIGFKAMPELAEGEAISWLDYWQTS